LDVHLFTFLKRVSAVICSNHLAETQVRNRKSKLWKLMLPKFPVYPMFWKYSRIIHKTRKKNYRISGWLLRIKQAELTIKATAA
jgi:hypothetical protein